MISVKYILINQKIDLQIFNLRYNQPQLAIGSHNGSASSGKMALEIVQ